jgi:NAD(P)-dependent dehydrogenase (short-subunit alcohol dehydrogenase family)
MLKVFKRGYERFGEDAAILFNNAGIGGVAGPLGRLLDGRKYVNLWGVVYGVQTFVAKMIKQNTPARYCL